MRKLDSVLKALVDRTSPSSVKLNVRKSSFLGHGRSYEVTITRRGWDESFCGDTVAGAIRNALDVLESPGPEGKPDPGVPSWYLVSRMQRELVEQLLHRHLAKHMARAAKANLSHSREAAAEYAMADAFKAALDALFIEDAEDGTALPTEPLEHRDETSPVVRKGREVERTGERAPSRGDALAKAVKELRERNKMSAGRTKTIGDKPGGGGE